MDAPSVYGARGRVWAKQWCFQECGTTPAREAIKINPDLERSPAGLRHRVNRPPGRHPPKDIPLVSWSALLGQIQDHAPLHLPLPHYRPPRSGLC
jgi:hypothetical protein